MNLPKLRVITFLLFFLSLNGLAGCTAMPKTHSDFLSAEDGIHSEEYADRNIEVVWRVSDPHDINAEEQALLLSKLESALSESIERQNKPIKIRAAITRIEAVSPTLNWISSILLFVPMDHGGAAVELEAIDLDNHEVISQLRFANWTPISEFSAHFTRLKPASLALALAAEEFALQLETL
ncbi:MAG: hypothetical protein V7785_09865 [Bermanella sp.]